MELKNARSRLATARTALQKADGIIELCEEMEHYAPNRGNLEMVQREIHQQVGRIDLLYNLLQTIEDTTPTPEEE